MNWRRNSKYWKKNTTRSWKNEGSLGKKRKQESWNYLWWSRCVKINSMSMSLIYSISTNWTLCFFVRLLSQCKPSSEPTKFAKPSSPRRKKVAREKERRKSEFPFYRLKYIHLPSFLLPFTVIFSSYMIFVMFLLFCIIKIKGSECCDTFIEL